MDSSPISYFRLPEPLSRIYGLPGERLTGVQKMQTINEPYETNEAYSLALNVQGVKPEDIAVIVSDGRLIIEFEKEYDPNKVAHTNWDKSFGIFTRWFSIPKEIGPENLKTKVIGGRLEIQLTKNHLNKVGIDKPKSKQEKANVNI